MFQEHSKTQPKQTQAIIKSGLILSLLLSPRDQVVGFIVFENKNKIKKKNKIKHNENNNKKLKENERKKKREEREREREREREKERKVGDKMKGVKSRDKGKRTKKKKLPVEIVSSLIDFPTPIMKKGFLGRKEMNTKL